MKKAELAIQTVVITILVLLVLVVVLVLFNEQVTTALGHLSNYVKQAIGLTEASDPYSNLGGR